MLIAWLQDSVPPRARYAERPGRWIAESSWPPAARPARGCTSPRGSARAGGGRARRCSRCQARRPRPRRRGMVRGRPLGRPAVRPARRRRPLAVLRLAAAGRAARAARTRSRRPHADQRSPARARERAALRGAARRRVADGHARAAQPHAPRRPRSRRPADSGRAVRRPRAAGRDRAPLRGGLAAARRALADLLAAGLAVAGGGHARRRPRRSSIELPLHDASAAPAAPELCPPEEPPEYPMTEVAPGHGARTIMRELGSGRTELRFDWDLGGTNRDEVTGTEITFEADAIFEIVEDRAALGAGRLHERDGAAARARGLGRALRDAHRDDVRRRALPDRVAAARARRRRGDLRCAPGRSRSRARAAEAHAARRRAARRARPAAWLPQAPPRR